MTEFRILGPLEVLEDGRALDVGTGKQRAVLAVLLLHPGEVVSRDRLIDALWDERAPPSAPNSVHVYVSRLRKALGNGQLETHGHGYRLVLEPEQLDLARFERLLGEGRELLAMGEPERSAETLRAALSLWRGPPLSDLAREPFAQTEIARLGELHLAALEERVEADLALGRHAELVPELEALVRRNPLRERLRGQLMLALYGSGRQAEALETYQQARRTLSEELGLEPSRQLQELEGSILRQDTHLDLPRRAFGAAGRARRTPGVLVAVGAGLLLAAAAAVAGIGLVRDESPGLSAASANAVAAIDAGSLRLIADVPVGDGPSNVAADDFGVWVVNSFDDTVSRLDPKAGAVIDRVDVGRVPSGIAVGDADVWVANSLDATVSRIDSRTNRVAEPISVGLTPLAVAVDGTTVWVTNSGDRSVTRIDAASGRVIDRIPTDAFGRGIAIGGGGVWITDETSARVVLLDPRRGRVVRTVGVGNGPTAIAFGHGAMWIANSFDGTVSRIDADTGRVTATISVGEGPRGIAVGSDVVWVSSEFTEELVRIDPQTNEAVERIPIGNRPQGLALAGNEIWFGVQASGREHRGGRLVSAGGGQIQGSIDPSYISWAGTFGSLSPAYDGLVGFARRGGSDGTQLVPNLAESLPVVTGGGTTYAFRLRRGIRYSDGRFVRASDFRRSLERAYRGKSPPLTILTGAPACMQRPQDCELSRGIRTDDAAGTIVFNLQRPDDEFLRQLTFLWPVPRGTPLSDMGSRRLRVAGPGAAGDGGARLVPSTGPYMIESYVPGRRLVLVRNPFFRLWSKLARPEGLPDAIELRLGALNEPAVKAVERDGVDLAEVPLDDLDEVAAFDGFRGQFPARVHEQVVRATVLLFLNTTKPPFDDVRVRRAINYAVDRVAIAASYGSRPTCQLRPPGTVGFRRFCPYTVSPNRAGEWRAPDLGRARRLVLESGTRGMSVGVWTYGQSPGFWEQVAQGSARALENIGYRATIRRVKDLDAYIEIASSAKARGVQAGVSGWYGPPPQASSLLDLFLCGDPQNWSFFCDARIDARIDQAFEIDATDPERAAALWARLERDLVDLAPWVPVFTPSHTSVVSERLGNYQRNPDSGTQLDQLWVR
jgi:peptide/nickel transport system substrate-binding protein